MTTEYVAKNQGIFICVEDDIDDDDRGKEKNEMLPPDHESYKKKVVFVSLCFMTQSNWSAFSLRTVCSDAPADLASFLTWFLLQTIITTACLSFWLCPSIVYRGE